MKILNSIITCSLFYSLEAIKKPRGKQLVSSWFPHTQKGRENYQNDELLDEWTADEISADDSVSLEDDSDLFFNPYKSACQLDSKTKANTEWRDIMHDFKFGKILKNNKKHTFTINKNGYPFNWGTQQQSTSYNKVTWKPSEPTKLELTWQDPDTGRTLQDHWLHVTIPNAADWDKSQCKVYAHRSTNENYLNFKYGTKRFIPMTAIIFTWNCNSEPMPDCPWDSGSTFQIVLTQNQMARVKNNKGRVVFSFAKINEDELGDGENSNYQPKFRDSYGDMNTLEETNKAFKRFIFWKFDKQPTSLYQPPIKPMSCINLEHCHCGPIKEAPEITWNLDIDNDIEFRGYCSQNKNMLNYPHKLEWREHICYVKCKSENCMGGSNGKIKHPMATRFDTDGNQIFEYKVEASSFICEVDENRPDDGPKWVRRISNKEKILLKDIEKVEDAFTRSSGLSTTCKRYKPSPEERKQWLEDRASGIETAEETRANKRAARKAHNECLRRAAAEKLAKKQEKQAMMDMMGLNRQASETTLVEMGYTCGHPETWKSQLQHIGVIDPENPDKDEPEWYNKNFDRGSTWICEDANGNMIRRNGPVPYKGKCWMTCPGKPELDLPNGYAITCSFWDKAYGARQYLTGSLKHIVTLTDVEDDNYRGPEGGWSC